MPGIVVDGYTPAPLRVNVMLDIAKRAEDFDMMVPHYIRAPLVNQAQGVHVSGLTTRQSLTYTPIKAIIYLTLPNHSCKLRV